jgi:hypothetical protein
MSEHEEPSQDWTVNTLFTYIITRFKLQDDILEERKQAQNEAMKAALAAAEKAVVKAEIATEKRFDSVNEFRKTLTDQATLFMPRLEFQVSMVAMNERLSEIKARLDKQEGRGLGLNAGWGYLIGGITIVSIVIGLILRF